MFIAPGLRKAGSKSKKGKTTLSGQAEGSSGKDVTGDTNDEIEDIEDIEGAGDPALHLGMRAMARLQRIEPRMTNLQIELESQLRTVTQFKGRVANLTTQILDMAEGAWDPTNGKRTTLRTSLTADLVEMHDTKMIRPITTSHPLAAIHHIITFLNSFYESELINLVVAEMEILMVIQKGHSLLKVDINKVISALKADHEIEYERGWMLDTLTSMFMHRFNVQGSEVPLDFNTISIITAALGLMCKRAVDLVSGMDTSGVATNMHANQVITKMTYPPDHADEYEGLTLASAKDLAKNFVVRFAFIMGKRLTRNLKIQSQAKAAAPHYEASEGTGGPELPSPQIKITAVRGSPFYGTASGLGHVWSVVFRVSSTAAYRLFDWHQYCRANCPATPEEEMAANTVEKMKFISWHIDSG
eukprot:jgi/Tetstr1/460585/TSEL_000510.t1